jgi:hypothetical protein
MANSLLITKLSDDSFSFVVNGATVNTITNLRKDKLQQILYNQVTIVDGATLPVATSPLDLRIKLRSAGFWDWMSSGGSGVDRFDELADTTPYFGNDGKVPIVDEAQLKLLYTDLPDTSYLDLFPTPLQPLKALRANAGATAYEFYDAVNIVTQFIRSGYTETAPSEDVVFQALQAITAMIPPVVLPQDLQSVLYNGNVAVFNDAHQKISVFGNVENQFDLSSYEDTEDEGYIESSISVAPRGTVLDSNDSSIGTAQVGVYDTKAYMAEGNTENTKRVWLKFEDYNEDTGDDVNIRIPSTLPNGVYKLAIDLPKTQFPADGIAYSYDLGVAIPVKIIFIEGVPVDDNDWSQTGSIITFTFVPELDKRIKLL